MTSNCPPFIFPKITPPEATSLWPAPGQMLNPSPATTTEAKRMTCETSTTWTWRKGRLFPVDIQRDGAGRPCSRRTARRIVPRSGDILAVGRQPVLVPFRASQGAGRAGDVVEGEHCPSYTEAATGRRDLRRRRCRCHAGHRREATGEVLLRKTSAFIPRGKEQPGAGAHWPDLADIYTATTLSRPPRACLDEGVGGSCPPCHGRLMEPSDRAGGAARKPPAPHRCARCGRGQDPTSLDLLSETSWKRSTRWYSAAPWPTP